MKVYYIFSVALLIFMLMSCLPINHSDEGMEKTVSADDGVAIAYDVRGRGDTSLVFIHGWCSNRSFWHNQLDVFADDYQVIAVDLPGHGNSGRARNNWSISSFAADIETVVKSLDLKRIVLIGHSMGGLVSLEAAHRLSDSVIGIVGADTIGDVESEEEPEMMDIIINAFQTDFAGTMKTAMPRMFSQNAPQELVQWVTDNSVQADPAMAVAIFREVSVVDEKQLLSAAGVPVRVVYAAPGDPSESHAYVKTNRKYADYEAVFIIGAGHFLHLENPDEFNNHLRAFLDELDKKK